MARDQLDETDQADPAGTPDSPSSPDSADSPDSAKSSPPAKSSEPAETDSAAASQPPSRPARGSGTAEAAARHRTAMQHRHLRIGLVMSVAIGVEAIGAAGLVGAGLLPWQWQEMLWGRSDGLGITLQVSVGLVVLALAVAWWRRSEPVPTRSRVALLAPAALVAVLALTDLWQADLGAPGAGPVVAALAAVLVLAGALTWLVGLQRLRVLFPFGLADSRARGYGNLAAVRLAQRVGGPAGAVGGAALLFGAFVVAPGWVGTVDSQTAEPLALTGDPATAVGDPAWSIQVPAAHETHASAVWATTGGLVIEEASGVRVVDPRTGDPRWHWRDEAYLRIGAVVTDGGSTVVLGLEYQGEAADRDRVVALDVGTGELRWERFDTDLVAALAMIAWAPADGDWFAVPQQEQAPGIQDGGSLVLRAIGSDGEERWTVSEDPDCTFVAVGADTSGLLVTTQQCVDPEPAGEVPGAQCLVHGLDPTSGERSWSWPEAEQPAPDCQVHPLPELVLVTFQGDQGRIAVALDPDTGQPAWTRGPDDDDDLAGLSDPVLVGDAVLGTELVTAGPDAGGAEVVVRAAADGELRHRVPLPAGQPIQLVPAGGGHAAVSLYQPEADELVVVDLDPVTATTQPEVRITGAPVGTTLRRVTMASGPAGLTVEALVAVGPEPGPDDYELHVHGW